MKISKQNNDGKELYFAYGSNLDPERMAERVPGAEALGVFSFQAKRLAFSPDRGVATFKNTRSDRDHTLAGVIYSLPEGGLKILDRFEGVGPGVYKRVVLRQWCGVDLVTYQHTGYRKMLDAGYNDPPSVEYVDHIVRGYLHHGLPLSFLAEALNASDFKPINAFVYGSLKSGFENHRVIAGCQLVEDRAEIAGCFDMVDLGAYPALMPGEPDCVRGEAYRIDAMDLVALDRLEGYPRFYSREIVITQGGNVCWVYFMNKSHATAYYSTPSGRLAHRGGAQEWLKDPVVLPASTISLK
jgi:gamma-glutamylcyclotransferase (GGCT)/AIG2-like uncharacterized protein YtfP